MYTVYKSINKAKAMLDQFSTPDYEMPSLEC